MDANPRLPIQYIGLTLELTNVFGVFCVILHRAYQVYLGKGQAKIQIMTLTVASAVFLSQIPQIMPWAYSNPAVLIPLYYIGVIATPIAAVMYLFFQIYVFERFRSFSKLSRWWTIGLYTITSIFFFGLQTPSLTGYYTGLSAYNAFWDAWEAYSFLWYIYVGILDVVLNITLLRLFWTSKALTSNGTVAGIKTKYFLLSLCIAVLLYDLFGVVALNFSNQMSAPGDQDAWSNRLGWGSLSNSAVAFHALVGLNYLSILSSYHTSASVNKKPKPLKPLSKPCKEPESYSIASDGGMASSAITQLTTINQ